MSEGCKCTSNRSKLLFQIYKKTSNKDRAETVEIFQGSELKSYSFAFYMSLCS